MAANRRAAKYTRAEQLQRVLWALAQPLFRLSPRPFFGWRAALLRLFGARIGPGVHVYPSARVFLPSLLEIGAGSAIGERAHLYNLGRVRIGRDVTVSQQAHLCAGTHDHEDPAMPLRRASIDIGSRAWVCADAFVGPDVTVGEGAILGARAVAMRDVPPWTIQAGNPARTLGERRLATRATDGVRPS